MVEPDHAGQTPSAKKKKPDENSPGFRDNFECGKSDLTHLVCGCDRGLHVLGVMVPVHFFERFE